jgi:RNA-directed DNA polymerase
MTLGQLLVDLTVLLEDPEANRAAIGALLAKNQKLAEFEVLRFLAAKVLAAGTTERLRSIDPRERLEGVKSIPLYFPRSLAAKLLRTVAKDPDITTRKHARAAIRALQIHDVALRDSRFQPSRWSRGPLAPGAYNPSGWAFGLYARRTPGTLRQDALGRHGLPVLSDRAAVAKYLGLASVDALARFLRPGTAPGSAYVEFEVKKATGGTRRIAAPRSALRAAQRKILAEILGKVPVHRAAHGFVPKRSTVTNAEAHVGAAVVVKLDLVDFFPSIHYRRVAGLFEELGYGAEAATALAGVCTYRPKLDDGRMAWPGLLPQGAPSSPAITNLVCRRLDGRLSALAKKSGATYTRYADDLTFSFATDPENDGGGDRGKKKLGRFLWWVDQICQLEGFSENTKKRRVFRRSGQQRVTGIVVNQHVAVPRQLRRRFRAILANVKKNGLAAESRGRDDFAAYLHGFAAYVQMVQPELGSGFAKEVEAVLAAERGTPA